MAKLENTTDAGEYFTRLIRGGAATVLRRGASIAMSAGLKIALEAIKKTKSSGPITDRVTDAAVQALDLVGRNVSGGLNDVLPLYRQFPGYITEYRNGELHNIIPFQFEAKITSDNRSAEFESIDYGVNSLHNYRRTILRKISLETYFATLDQTFYSSHYVETKIRRLQSLVYPTANDMMDIDKDSLKAPSVIGLFIGDKFMRRRLPRIKGNKVGSAIQKIQAAMPTDKLNKNRGFFATAEPIIWRVISVNTDWAETPYNLNFGELSYNLIPGASKLPMFQKVTLELEELIAPNNFETNEDAETFTGLPRTNSAASIFL